MNKKYFSIALAAIALTACTNIGASTVVEASGDNTTASVAVGSFNEISAENGIEVNYTVSPEVSVAYIAPQSVVDFLNIRVDNGELKCAFKPGTNVQLNGRKVTVDVSAPAVRELEAKSLAAIFAKGNLSSDKLDIDASSSATVDVSALTVRQLDIDASSSASVMASGQIGKADIEASSSAEVNFSGSADRIEAEASSSAIINIGAQCGYLDAEASSAATIDATEATVGSGKLEASSGATISVSKATNGTYSTRQHAGGEIIVK